MDTISGTILGKGLWKLVLPEVFRGQVTLENDGHRRRTFRRFPRVAVWKLDAKKSNKQISREQDTASAMIWD